MVSDIQHVLPGDHAEAMRLALSLATKSPCIPTNYRVGALIVNSSTGRIVATGYTLELPGNTHAEECCLLKLAASLPQSDAKAPRPSELLPISEPHTLYTTVEPCCLRLSGKTPCVKRVLQQKEWIRTVCYGFREPDVFVKTNTGLDELRAEGIEVVHVEGMEDKIRQVATEGHPERVSGV